MVFAAILMAMSCARSGAVDVAMVSAHADPVHFAFVPQFVDLRHDDLGWQRVPLATSAAKMEMLEYGHRVRLATSSLPRGQYTAIRVGYFVPGSTSSADPVVRLAGHSDDDLIARRTSRTRTLGDVTLQQHEVTLMRMFCVTRGNHDNQLTLQVVRAHPERPEEGPSLSIAESPRC